MRYSKFLIQFKELIEQTQRYIPPNARRSDIGGNNYDKYVDFPYIEDPEGYQTYKAIEQKDEDVEEQSGGSYVPGTAPASRKTIASEQDQVIKPEEAGEEDAEETAEETPDTGGAEGGDLEGGMPENIATGDSPGMDPTAGIPGADQKEEELTSSEIGRMYELKKIYARLSSVESYLSRATDQAILELRKYVAQSIDLFEVVISNYDQYKDNVDDIIVQFYEFLDVIYSELKKYYKDISKIKTTGS
ncbi:MAG: hypothetical protein K9L62_10865 [Vallitaleaceae bacterium]|nr:hypothetical protein [Vallitaleaceae bacterium]